MRLISFPRLRMPPALSRRETRPAQHRVDVILDGGDREIELVGDLIVREPGGDGQRKQCDLLLLAERACSQVVAVLALRAFV